MNWAGSDRLVANVDREAGAPPADLWLVLFDRTNATRVDRGENSGRALVNHHVVRSFRRIGRWQGEPLRVVVDLGGEEWTTRGCAVILQSDAAGPIVDATECTPPPG